MSEENLIGLAELIEQVKHELLYAETDTQKTAPIFSVDQVELEIQVTVRREGKDGKALRGKAITLKVAPLSW